MARRLAVTVANAANVAPLAYRQDVSGGPLIRLASIGTVGARDVAYTADGAYLSVSTITNYAVHKRDGDTHPLLTRTTNISAAGQGTAWHADGRRLIFTYSSANRMYPFLRTDDSYAYVGAVTNVTGNALVRSIGFGGDLLVFGVSAAPWMQTYRVDAVGMPTKLPNPSSTPTAAVASVAWAPPDRTILVLASGTTPGTLVVYSVAGDTRNRLADVTLPGTIRANSLSFTPDGTRLAVGTSAEPFLLFYAHDGAGGFTRLADPPEQPSGTVYSVAFPPDDGSQLAVASLTAPYLSLYNRTGDTLTLADAVADPPTLEATGLSWTPDDAPPPVTQPLAGTLSADLTLAGTLGQAQPLTGAVDVSADLTATLEQTAPIPVDQPLTGDVTADVDLAGTLQQTAPVALAGSVTADLNLAGKLEQIPPGSLIGAVAAEADLAATLEQHTVTAPLPGGDLTADATLVGTLDQHTVTTPLAGTTVAALTLAGTLGQFAPAAALDGDTRFASTVRRTGTVAVSKRIGVIHL